ncbi:MAG: hypothetical protein CVU57_21135 [Deltaproteobacteria bacterium HGW-Deltaproteobacteria-15]|jgi:hypothetical protein|nr:MAG: hypothetical protein CVU57_21135 [Deltaproteobacteria bacterium HGW-Deltaproteobacteria-15]
MEPPNLLSLRSMMASQALCRAAWQGGAVKLSNDMRIAMMKYHLSFPHDRMRVSKSFSKEEPG